MHVEDLSCSICLGLILNISIWKFSKHSSFRLYNLRNIWAQKEIFTPPIRMTEHCGHDFCQKCLVEFVSDENEWFCPECRSVQSKQPDNLVRNRRVERAVESHNAISNQANNLCSHHKLELSICKFLRFSVGEWLIF